MIQELSQSVEVLEYVAVFQEKRPLFTVDSKIG